MRDYRLFKLSSSGVIDSGWTVRFVDDEAACDHARTLADATPVEVWEGSRKVAVVHPTGRIVLPP